MTPRSEATPLATTLNGLAVLGLGVVLLGAYVVQFAWGEPPCLLCTLQRVAFVLSLVGFVLNLRFGPHPLHHAVILVAAGIGMLISGRQILLHVAPGTGVYGSAVLGLHLYTWAFLLFAAMIPGTALLLALPRPDAAPRPRPGELPPLIPRLVLALCWFAFAITLANALTSFLQCGPIDCPDDPAGWWITRPRL